MAAPQKENGFLAVATEIVEAVVSRDFTGHQCRILMLLWRETYGWQRRSADFSLGLIESKTGIPRKTASKILQKLVDLRVVVQTSPHSKISPAQYRFEKDYDLWEVGGGIPPQGDPLQRDRVSLPQGQGVSLPQGLIKERVKESSSEGIPPQGDTPPDEAILDLGTRVLRLLTQLQPSGLSQADRLSVAELVRNTDKSPRRVLEAVADAVRDTQAFRRENRVQAPVRFALSVVGRILSEPEPTPHAGPKFVQAPADWVPPYERSKPQ